MRPEGTKGAKRWDGATCAIAMLDLHRKLPDAKTDGERTMIQRQIDATDREIDALVYQLYGLTPDEIRIVEEATNDVCVAHMLNRHYT